MKSGCWPGAAVNVVRMTSRYRWSPVCRMYLITAVRALAAFHQPVVSHRPVPGWYHCWSAAIPAAARVR